MKCFKLQEIDYFILYFKFKIFMAICIYRKFIYVKEIHNCLCKSVWINLFIYFPWKSSFTTVPSVVKNMMPRRVIDLTTKNRLTSIKLNYPGMHWYFWLFKIWSKKILNIIRIMIPTILPPNLRAGILLIVFHLLLCFHSSSSPISNYHTEFCVYLTNYFKNSFITTNYVT